MTTDRAEWSDDVRVLSRAIDQAGDVLDHVHAGALGEPTPCSDWDVAALADHLVAAPAQFTAVVRGDQVDWSAAPEHVVEEWGPAFRVVGDDLLHAWHQHPRDASSGAGMQVAELGLHTWDLARAIDYPVERLDPEVAEVGLAFLRSNLTPDRRAPVFGPEEPVADDAGPYERLAAFAGRPVV